MALAWIYLSSGYEMMSLDLNLRPTVEMLGKMSKLVHQEAEAAKAAVRRLQMGSGGINGLFPGNPFSFQLGHHATYYGLTGK